MNQDWIALWKLLLLYFTESLSLSSTMVDIAKYFISKTTSKEDLKSKMMTKRKKEEVEDRGESKKPHKRSKGEVDERLEQAVSKLLDTTWSTALGPEVTKPYFIKLTRFITSVSYPGSCSLRVYW